MMRKLQHFIVLAFVMIFSAQAHAQNDFDALLEAGVDDANKLAEGYAKPFMNAFGTGMTNGWYNTAKAHKTLGFDLTVTVNAALVPNSDKLYDINKLNLSEVEMSGTNYTDGKVPTMFGPSEAPEYRNPTTGATFSGPEGLAVEDEIGFQAVPVPMAQLGIGIVKNTDLKIRFTPKIEIADDSEFKLIGFGVMHDVKQHIPGIKNLPFDLSGFVGYTKMTLTAGLADQDFSTNSGAGVYTQDGEGLFEVKSFTIQALISKKMSILTLYGSVGYNSVKSNVALNGEYEARDGSGFITQNFKDPIDLSFATSGPRLTGGFMLKLAILTLHADYTLQKYSTLTAGIGFTVR